MDHTIAFQRAETTYRSIADRVAHFPKKDRYTIGVRLETTALLVLEAIIAAEVSPHALRDRALIEAIVRAESAVVLARCARERQCLSETLYFTLVESFIAIAKMATGWRKALIVNPQRGG